MVVLSGMGKEYPAPEKIKKWNWGAFFTTFIWGYFNETFISFLMFVPIVNLIIPFYLGAKGNELAWQNKTWKNEEVFLGKQKKWAIFGWVFALIFIPIMVYTVHHQLEIRNLESYIRTEAIEMILNDEEASAFVGDDPEVVEYIRGKYDVLYEVTYSIVIQSSRAKYWCTVRLDENNKIKEILVSNYYVVEGFKEVLVEADTSEE